MKRESLSELFKKHSIEIPKEVIDAIMDENGKDLETLKKDAEKAKTDLKAAETKAGELEEQIKKRDGDIVELQKQATTSKETQDALTALQTKYDTDTKELGTKLETQRKEAEKQLADQEETFAAEKFFEGIPFASELARNAAKAEFKTAGLKLDKDSKKFLGADDWVKQLRDKDPAAFKADESDPSNTPPPYFVNPTNPSKNPPPNDAGAFNFGSRFNQLRQPPAQQQNTNPTQK